MSGRAGAAAAVLLALSAAGANGHEVGLSRGEYRLSGGTLEVELAFACRELIAVMPALDADGDGVLSAGEVAAAEPALAERIVGGVAVRGERGPCPGWFEGAVLDQQDGLHVAARYECGTEPGALSIHLGFLASLSLGHRHLAAVTAAAGSTERRVAHERQPDLEVAGGMAAAGRGVAWPLFRLGIEHIWTGYDHLLFLLGLVLVVDRPRRHLLAVTAFTVAHSLTLGLATLGIWAPGPGIVEPAIALSIVYVGVENWFVRDAGRRWRITFPFGLIHGFGFAGALREVALPPGQVPLALACFNAGVEVGQVAVLAVVLPAVLWLGRRSAHAELGARWLSAGIALAGLCWFAGRVG